MRNSMLFIELQKVRVHSHVSRSSSFQQFLELHAPCPEPKAGPPGGSIFRRTQQVPTQSARDRRPEMNQIGFVATPASGTARVDRYTAYLSAQQA